METYDRIWVIESLILACHDMFHLTSHNGLWGAMRPIVIAHISICQIQPRVQNVYASYSYFDTVENVTQTFLWPQ